MRLPITNSIVLGATNDDCVIDRTDPIAPTVNDVLALLPGWARSGVSAVRDAVASGYRAVANFAWARTGQSIARLASPRFSAGLWLDEHWGELLHRARVAGETDGEYRSRLLADPDVVTPNALRQSITAIVAEYTNIAPIVMEPATDGMFAAGSDEHPWMCFAQPESARLWGEDPTLVGIRWGVYAVPDVVGALFWVVLPGDPGSLEPVLFAMANDAAITADMTDNFAAPGDGAYAFAFVNSDPLLDRINHDVESRRAAGVAWMAFCDFALALSAV